jgi:predicted RNA-binding protein YlxR (DUF448 family)
MFESPIAHYRSYYVHGETRVLKGDAAKRAFDHAMASLAKLKAKQGQGK